MVYKIHPPGFLVPTSLNKDGTIKNGYIALHNTHFGSFESTKSGDRVRCRSRNKCILKQNGGKTNQGKIKRNGLEFEWVSPMPPPCCDFPPQDVKLYGRNAPIVSLRRLQAHNYMSAPGATTSSVMTAIRSRTPSNIIDEKTNDRMRQTIWKKNYRKQGQIKPACDRPPIDQVIEIEPDDDVDAIQKKIKIESFKRQMHDLRDNPENTKYRICHRPKLNTITGEPENIVSSKVPMHMPKDQITDEYAYSSTPQMRQWGAESDIWSIDQAHQPAFAEAERTIGIRGRHAVTGNWEWILQAIVVGKKQALHRELVSSYLKKITKEGNNVDKLRALRCDLEVGLWKPTVEEINKAKSSLRVVQCEPEFCSSHVCGCIKSYVQKTPGARKFQQEVEGFEECLEDLRAVRFLPPEKIKNQMTVILKTARTKLNDGKQGNGVVGSPMAAFFNIWVTFWNEIIVKLSDEFNTLKALSVQDRIDDSSNQGHEGCNRDWNEIHRIAASYKKKKTLRTYASGCQNLERRFNGKMESDRKQIPRRPKNKNKRQRDKSFKTAQRKYKKMKYSKIESENDRLFLERCKDLVRLSRADF